MIDKIFMVVAGAGIVLVGLLMLPYLLYLGWVRIIALNKQWRGLDLHSSAPNSVG